MKNISIITILFTIITSPDFAQKKEAKIIVGPNVQVSLDGNFSHTEYMLAANPIDPSNLIGVASIFPFKGEGRMSIPYVSNDGGKSWKGIDFPDQMEDNIAADPEIGFDRNGKAYFTACTTYYENEKPVPSLFFYRSKNGGNTWERSFSKNLIGKLQTYDRPQLMIDQSNSKFSKRIYISIYSPESNRFPNNKMFQSQYFLWLLRSEDEGKSFTGPYKVVSGNEGMGLNVCNLLISSKGVLFFPYIEWYNDKSLSHYFNGRNIYLVSSKDGGVTFSLPKKIGSQGSMNNVFPQFAIDNQSIKYRDRLYCVYGDTQNGKSQLMFTYSKNEGKTWTKPKLVAPDTSEYAGQYQAAVTVNSKGIIGIRWYDTRGTDLGSRINEYFTASLDGGDSFLSPEKVSSQSSPKRSTEQEAAIPTWRRSPDKDSIIIFFQSVQNQYPGGGDYMQFSADATGVFHDFWADQRDGRAYQIFTSAIKVIESGAKEEKTTARMEGAIMKEKEIDATPKNINLSNISRFVYLQMGTSSYDTTTNVFSIPVRIRNISNKPIYGPIKLEIISIDTSKGKSNSPIILNSDNKIEGPGAVFNYILSKNNALQPGKESAELMLKFNLKIEKHIFHLSNDQIKQTNLDKDYLIIWLNNTISNLHTTVTGYTEQEE